MDIIKSIDEKLIHLTYKWCRQFDNKPNVISLVGMAWSVHSLIKTYSKTPFYVYCPFLLMSLYFCLMFLYETRIWYRIKKQETIKVGGRFFEDNANLRKWFFFGALTILIFKNITSISQYDSNKIDYFISHHKFIDFLIYRFVHGILYAIIIIEFIRGIAVSGGLWSNRKHFTFVAIASILFFMFVIVNTILILHWEGLLGSVFFWDIIFSR